MAIIHGMFFALDSIESSNHPWYSYLLIIIFLSLNIKNSGQNTTGGMMNLSVSKQMAGRVQYARRGKEVKG